MFRLSLDPKLPWLSVNNYAVRLHERLTHLLRETARTVQQVQSPPVTRVTKTGVNQSISAATLTVVTMTASIDTHAFWDATNNRFRPRDFTGYYRVSAIVSFGAQAVTDATRILAIYNDGVVYSQVRVPQVADEPLTLCITDVVYLDGKADGTGSYVDVRVTTDDATVIAGAANNCAAAFHYLGGDQVA